MKKHLTFAVCLFAVATLFCCSKPDDNGGDTPVPAPTPDPNPEIIDYVHIPDINFKTYLLENFDIDKDGGISASEAGKAYRLYILIGMNSVVFDASVSSREETHSIDL